MERQKKIIAIRKKPRVDSAGLSTALTKDKRLQLANQAGRSDRIQEFEKAGIIQVRLGERTSPEQSSFQRLGHLAAYIVNVTKQDENKRVEDILGDEYDFMPSGIELTLPNITLGNTRLNPSKSKEFPWSFESGIEQAHKKGITGGNVIVGVLDTGCDVDHQEFASKRIDFRYVPHDRRLNPIRNVRGFDTYGHGTHVCGIIAGQSIGIAPDVELMVAAVIESETLRTSLERITIGLEWMLSYISQRDNLDKPAIINMSLGFRSEDLQEEERRTAMMGIRNILRTLYVGFDVLPIVSVGNDGINRIRVPAHFDEVLSVGAVDDNHQITPFSGSGVSPVTDNRKPDLVGYGHQVMSSFERDVNNQSWYSRMDGTSMAAPYATGIAALYASSNQELKGEQLRQKLINNAMPLNAPVDRRGAGLARFILP